MGQSDVSDLMAKKGATAFIWNFFGVRDNAQEKDEAICRLCHKTVFASGGKIQIIYQFPVPQDVKSLRQLLG